MSKENRDSPAAAYGIPAPDHRLPAATRVGPVRLQVSDLARSLEYYQRVLGMRVLDRADAGATLADQGGSPLVELRALPGASPVPARGRPGLFHFAILLPDRASLGAFIRHLGELGEQAGASDHLVSEALYLRDPDGLGIEVYADRPRSEWRHRQGQLIMTTEALHLASVVSAAADTDWGGMPAGTTIGHLHLHVGDLAAAEDFYHRGLGLDKTVWSYRGALFLSAGGYHHHLGVNTWAAGAAPAGEGDAKLLEWALIVPGAEDVQRALRSLEGAGHLVEAAGDEGLTRDPWGTPLRIRSDDHARPSSSVAPGRA